MCCWFFFFFFSVFHFGDFLRMSRANANDFNLMSCVIPKMAQNDALFYSNYIIECGILMKLLYSIMPSPFVAHHSDRILSVLSLKLDINCYYRQIRFEFHDSIGVLHLSEYVFHYKLMRWCAWIWSLFRHQYSQQAQGRHIISLRCVLYFFFINFDGFTANMSI